MDTFPHKTTVNVGCERLLVNSVTVYYTTGELEQYFTDDNVRSMPSIIDST